MLLRDALSSLSAARPLAAGTLSNYQRAVRYFGDFIGADPRVDDLDSRRVNSWLARMEDNYDASYCRSLRRDLLVVWNHAADIEECVHPKPRLIRIPKMQPKTPFSWPVHWIPQLLESVSTINGVIKRWGIERSVYAEAYLRVELDLLCRPTDMRRLMWSQVEGDGHVTWTQNKTGRIQRCKISREALRAMNRLRGLHETYVFPLSKTATELLICKIFLNAGIEKPPKQSLGHLRHTGGTAIAASAGNDAARAALGHSPESRVFERHYLDVNKLPVVESTQWWKT